MPATFEPLATTTLGSATNTVTFSSISGSYTDLVLVADGLGSGATIYPFIRFNSDTGTNYSRTYVRGDGSSASSGRDTTTATLTLTNWPTTQQNNIIIHINNYSNSTTYKTTLTRSNTPSEGVEANVGLWRNTAAITSVTLGVTSNNFASGSTFTLYGILSA